MKEITKGKGEIVSRQDVKGMMIYPKMGWDRLELPDNHYEFREKDYRGIIVMPIYRMRAVISPSIVK